MNFIISLKKNMKKIQKYLIYFQKKLDWLKLGKSENMFNKNNKILK